MLLEQGYPLVWATSTVERMVQKISLAKLQNTTGMPMGHQRVSAILAICDDLGIERPKLKPQTSREHAVGVPWSKPKKVKSVTKHFRPISISHCR